MNIYNIKYLELGVVTDKFMRYKQYPLDCILCRYYYHVVSTKVISLTIWLCLWLTLDISALISMALTLTWFGRRRRSSEFSLVLNIHPKRQKLNKITMFIFSWDYKYLACNHAQWDLLQCIWCSISFYAVDGWYAWWLWDSFRISS